MLSCKKSASFLLVPSGDPRHALRFGPVSSGPISQEFDYRFAWLDASVVCTDWCHQPPRKLSLEFRGGAAELCPTQSPMFRHRRSRDSRAECRTAAFAADNYRRALCNAWTFLLVEHRGHAASNVFYAVENAFQRHMECAARPGIAGQRRSGVIRSSPDQGADSGSMDDACGSGGRWLSSCQLTAVIGTRRCLAFGAAFPKALLNGRQRPYVQGWRWAWMPISNHSSSCRPNRNAHLGADKYSRTRSGSGTERPVEWSIHTTLAEPSAYRGSDSPDRRIW